MSSAATGAAAAAAAIANAIKASGVLVRVEPQDFLGIVQRQAEPLVVQSTAGFFSTSYRYLTTYKGLAFHTTSATPVDLPGNVELITASAISIPG